MDYALKISGDFKKGECEKCPIRYFTFNKYGEREEWCPVHAFDCPLKEVPDTNVGEIEQGEWIPVSERLPENEQPALITCRRNIVTSKNNKKTYYFIAFAFYTDGEHNTEESDYGWYDACNYTAFKYDEETDAYIIPEGWWEKVRFADEFYAVDCEVVAWMPLPEPYKKGGAE